MTDFMTFARGQEYQKFFLMQIKVYNLNQSDPNQKNNNQPTIIISTIQLIHTMLQQQQQQKTTYSLTCDPLRLSKYDKKKHRIFRRHIGTLYPHTRRMKQ